MFLLVKTVLMETNAANAVNIYSPRQHSTARPLAKHTKSFVGLIARALMSFTCSNNFWAISDLSK
jgi:hypothetical protein